MTMYTHPSQFEPLFISSERPAYRHLIGLASELVELTAKLEAVIPEKTGIGLSELVEGMNCYYSNLIEGHHTRPVDIAAALSRKTLGSKSQQDMIQMAQAHILTAKWAKNATLVNTDSITKFVIETHQYFCSQLPDTLLTLSDGSIMKPGCIRAVEVMVGRHIPPKHDAILQFLTRYDNVYSKILNRAQVRGKDAGIHKLEAIIASIIAHHRLVWVHPFPDGNGRVARIVLDAMLRESGVKSIGLLSMSRGFAKSDAKYKLFLDAADEHRMGDLDGRGNLSEKRLIEFCEFSLKIACDQVKFMSRMFSTENIEKNCMRYFNTTKKYRPESAYLYLHALKYGELERGEASRLTGLSERSARDVLKLLIQDGFLISNTPKGVVRASFPLCALGSLFPNLYPAGDLDDFDDLDENSLDIEDKFST